MKKARKTTSTESRAGNAAQTLAHPSHPIWGMLGLVVRLGVIGSFVFGATYLTSTDYGFTLQDEVGRDLLTFLALGGWSEYQRRRPAA